MSSLNPLNKPEFEAEEGADPRDAYDLEPFVDQSGLREELELVEAPCVLFGDGASRLACQSTPGDAWLLSVDHLPKMATEISRGSVDYLGAGAWPEGTLTDHDRRGERCHSNVPDDGGEVADWSPFLPRSLSPGSFS